MVVTVEVFAEATSDEAPSLSVWDQDTAHHLIQGALAGMVSGTPVPVIAREVSVYEHGAIIEAVCVAASGEVATDAIAAELAELIQARPEYFRDWGLATGLIKVFCSDS